MKNFIKKIDSFWVLNCFLLLKISYFHYTNISELSLGVILFNIGFIIIATSVTLLLKERTKFRILFIFNFIFSFLIFGNLLFLRYYNNVLSLYILFQIRNVSGLGGSIFEIISFTDFFYFIDLPLIFLYRKRHLNIPEGITSSKVLLKKFAIVFFIGIILFMSKPLQSSFADDLSVTDVFEGNERLDYVKEWGLPFYHIFDFTNIIITTTQDYDISKSEKIQIESWFEQKLKGISSNNKNFGIAANQNVIVIQVEALQHFVINRKINGQEITPHLNALLKESIYFDNIYYQTADGNTSDSEFIINTSLYPLRSGAVNILYPGNTYFSLANILRNKGYSTSYFHGNNESFWNREEMIPSLGFDTFYHEDYFDMEEEIGFGLSDEEFFNQSLDYIKEKEEPFYTFLATLTSHYPYNYEVEKKLFLGEWEDTLIGNFINTINYTDAAIGSFLATLEEEGILDNSVLVVFGDHIAIPDHNREELEEFVKGEAMSEVAYQELKRIPLIIRLPKGEVVEVNSTLGGQVDIMPTLLPLLGIQRDYNPYMFGKDLFLEEDRMIVLPSRGLITEEYFYNGDYLYHREEGNILESEDLEGLLDEARNVFDINEVMLRGDFFSKKNPKLVIKGAPY